MVESQLSSTDTADKRLSGAPLEAAAQYGHLEVVSFMLDQGEFIPGFRYACNMAMFYACESEPCNIELIKLLLIKGADLTPGRPNARGYSHVAWACRQGKADVMKVMLQYGDIDLERSPCGRSLLTDARLSENVELVRLLLEAGVDFTNTWDYRLETLPRGDRCAPILLVRG